MGANMTIRGDRQVSAKFRGLSAKAQDVTPAWRKFGSWLGRTMQQQFVSEGARLGRPWKPLKPEYRLQKMRNGWSRKILVRSGAMKKLFTGRPMQIEVYTPKTAHFGVSDQKAVWQHFGTHRDGKRVIPPRKILFVTPEMKRVARDRVADHIMSR